MKKHWLGLICIIFIFMFNSVQAATVDNFENVTEKANNMIVVKKGTVIEYIQKGATLSVNNQQIAIVEGQKIKIADSGRFKVTVSIQGQKNTISYDFFAWNAHLKDGRFYTYNDANRKNKTSILYSSTYLDLSEANSTAFKVDDYVFKTGKYNGELKGKYITSYYDKNKNQSTSKYYVYAMKSDFKAIEKTKAEVEVIFHRNTSTKDQTIKSVKYISGGTNQKFIDCGWTNANTGYALNSWKASTGTIYGTYQNVSDSWIDARDGQTIHLYAVWNKIIVDSVKLNKNNITLKVGEKNSLKVTFTPSNVADKNVTWSSSDSNIATVDKEGNVTAKKEGKATITVTTKNGNQKASCIVNVTNKVATANISFKNITEKVNNVIIVKNGTTIECSNLNAELSVSDLKMATVEGNKIKIINSGRFKITASIEGQQKTSTYDFFAWNAYLKGGQFYTYNDANRKSKTAILYSKTYLDLSEANSSAFKVEDYIFKSGRYGGELKGKYITSYYDKNNKKSTSSSYEYAMTTNIKTPPTTQTPANISVQMVTLNASNIELTVGGAKKLIATITPTNATNKNVTWSSSDSNIAIVDTDGNITAKKEGKVVISVTTKDGNKKANCTVNITKKVVSAPVKDATLTIMPKNQKIQGVSGTNVEITVNAQRNFTVKFAPNGGTSNTQSTPLNGTFDHFEVQDKSGKKINQLSGIKTKDGLIKLQYKLVKGEQIIVAKYKYNKITLPVAIRVGYEFKGWYLDKTENSYKLGMNGIQYEFKDPRNVTVYAQWKKIEPIKVTGVSIKKNITLEAGKNEKLALTITPTNAANKEVTWASANSSIAKVDKNGNVTGVKAGTTVITVKTADGAKVASCEVKVTNSNQFQNPLRDKNGKIITGADPWVIYKDGYYYFTYTNYKTIRISKTKNLQDIGQNPKTVYTSKNNVSIWAPELHYINGRWYIYYSDIEGETEKSHNDNRRMFVLRSKTTDPLGEYEYMGKIYDKNHDYFAIDGTVLEWNNELYFLWSGWDRSSWTSGIPHNVYIAKLNKEKPWIIEGERSKLIKPERSWEKTGGNNVTEGPQVLIKDGVLHIVYSACGAATDYYCLGMLTYKGGDILNASSWTKSKEPVFKSGNGVYSPGHCSFAKSPDGREDWIVYHAANQKGDSGKWIRNTRIQKFTWNGTTPVFGTPVPTDSYSNLPSSDKTKIVSFYWSNGTEYKISGGGAPRVYTLKNGNLIAGYETANAQGYSEIITVISNDGGKTWGTKKNASFYSDKNCANINFYSVGNELYMAYRAVKEISKNEVYTSLQVSVSTDLGITWKKHSTIVEYTNKGFYGVWEPCLGILNGKLTCFYANDSRTVVKEYQNIEYLVWNGSTWTNRTIVSNGKSHYSRDGMPVWTRLKTGEYVLLIESSKYNSKGKPFVIQMIYSADGVNWSKPVDVYIPKTKGSKAAAPGIIQIASTGQLVISFQTDDDSSKKGDKYSVMKTIYSTVSARELIASIKAGSGITDKFSSAENIFKTPSGSSTVWTGIHYNNGWLYAAAGGRSATQSGALLKKIRVD